MAFEGYIDRVTETEISGWIFDNRFPNQPLAVEILAGNTVLCSLTADTFREDLLAAGKGNGRHAFSFSATAAPPPPGEPLRARLKAGRWFIPPSGGYDLTRLIPMRFDSKLSHSLEYGMPMSQANCGFSTPTANSANAMLGKRLILAYEKTIQDDPNYKLRKHDQWQSVEAEFHQELLKILNARDGRALVEYLSDAHAKGITWGITQGQETTAILRRDEAARRLIMLELLDYLTSVAEYLGVLDVECSDQIGQWAENIHSDPLELIDRISAAIGTAVVLPQVVGSAFGLRTGQGILSTRDLLALYAALRIKTLTGAGSDGIPSKTVCEIGGGLGGVAYYANRLGIADYTIIDLPLVSLLQGYFLISALPDAKIALYGEETNGAAIKLMPTYTFKSPEKQPDLLFNQDSIPEMHPDYSLGYLREMLAKKIPMFLSINQEARAPQNQMQTQTVVRELVAAATAAAYRREHRCRHWLRAGYVEELYRLVP
jgi:hypothetical protein